MPGLVDSMKVEPSGTSTIAKAGLGLFTVRAQSQAITVSLLPRYGSQVRAIFRHLFGYFDLGIEMTDAFLGFVAHPLAVVAHIFGEPLRAFPPTL